MGSSGTSHKFSVVADQLPVCWIESFDAVTCLAQCAGFGSKSTTFLVALTGATVPPCKARRQWCEHKKGWINYLMSIQFWWFHGIVVDYPLMNNPWLLNRLCWWLDSCGLWRQEPADTWRTPRPDQSLPAPGLQRASGSQSGTYCVDVDV